MAGKPRIPESEWDNLCIQYKAGVDVAILAQPYGVGREAIYRILRKRGVVVEKRGGSPPIDETVRGLICDLYKQKHGATSIARLFGIDKRSVYNILTRVGIGTRPRRNRTGDTYHVPKYQVDWLTRERRGHLRGPKGNFNFDAFKKLDETACYWVGYLITDGCIGAYDGRSYRLYLTQARKHREQCEKLRAYLHSDLCIEDFEQETFGHLRSFSRVSFTLPDEVAQRLLKLGIKPAKTARVRPNEALITHPDFWRGVIEGDGTVCMGYIRMNSSSPVLAGIYRRLVRSMFGMEWVHTYRNEAGVWGIDVSKGEIIYKLALWLYPTDNVLGLERKKSVGLYLASKCIKENPPA
jgi:hypothetical protein